MNVQREEAVKRAVEAPDFVIDEEHGALLNTNTRALLAYKTQRREAMKAREMYARMDRIEHTVDELKELLLKVLNK